MLEILVCPSTSQPLRRASPTALRSADGSRSYPIVDGIPVILREDRSVFSIADYTSRPAYHGAPDPVLRTERIARRLVPSLSRDVMSARNYREFSRLLRERRGRARVLVVGGSIEGQGFGELLAPGQPFDIVDIDPSIGARTAVVCDGHDLPFRDGTFDGAVCQAVLEHVADPARVVSEIHRVLRSDGLVYSEIPFMQQVHEGPHDFSRVTLTGHRRLFRCFEELEAGPISGPGTALAWSIKYFARSIGGDSRLLGGMLVGMALLTSSWLKYLDPWLLRSAAGVDAAAGTYFLGRRADEPISDREIIQRYEGAGRPFALTRGMSSGLRSPGRGVDEAAHELGR